MHILINNLYQDLRGYSSIIIYGVGMYANKVYPLLKKMGLKKNIVSFVVTKIESGLTDIDGIPVIPFRSIILSNLREYAVLVAVSEVYCQEINTILDKFELKKRLLLTDYIISENQLKESSDIQFCKYIEEWHICNELCSENKIIEKNIEYQMRYEHREVLSLDKRMIVFIVGNLFPRIVKIMCALVRSGFKIVVLAYGITDSVFDTIMHNELQKYDIKYTNCIEIEELFYLALQYNPLVYYFETAWGDCSWADIMIRHQKVFGKIVISVYDVLNDGYVHVSDSQKEAEKYSLENASGIVWRYFSKEFLEKKKGFKYKGKSIQFIDYCGGYVLEEKEEDLQLRLCFISGNPSNYLENNNMNNGYIEEARIENILKQIGNREDCIFHLYAGTVSNHCRELCDILERKYYNFKVFYGTEHDKLINKISEYDYGCFLFTGGEVIPDTTSVNNIYYGSEYINSVSNRFFDYIDAGIPIVATRPLKLCNLLDEYGIIVKMDLSNLDIEYLKENREVYREKVKMAKKELLIDNQIQRLIDFFNEL